MKPLRTHKTLPLGARVVGAVRSYATIEECRAAAASRRSENSRAAVIANQIAAERLAKINAPTVTTSAARKARLLALLNDAPGVSADTQADRLLRALLTGTISTVECRQYLDIACPSARVIELRDRGHQISTRWIVQASAAGRLHRWIEYFLIRE